MSNHNASKSSLLKKLRHYVSTHLLAITGFSILINLLQLTVPLYMMQVFDRVLPGKSADTLLYLTLMAVVALIVWGGLQAVRQRILGTISHWMESQIGLPMFQRSISGILEGNIYAAQAQQDLLEVKAFTTSPAATIIFDLPWIPIYLIVVFLIHPLLGLIVTLGGAILLLITYRHEQSVRDLVEDARLASSAPRQIYTNALNKADTVMAMGMRSGLNDRWENAQNSAALPAEDVANRSSNYLATVRTFRMILQLALLGTGGFLAMHGKVSGGAMIAASIIGGRALQPVEQLTGAWATLLRAYGAFNRLEEFLSDEEEAHSIALPDPRGHVTVSDLYFKYFNAEKPTLNNIALQAHPGTCLGIIGPSGSGKSTLLKSLVGVIKPTRGHIRLDGAEVYQWQPEARGLHVGYLGQQIQLFPGTIAENIARMAQPDGERVVKAAQLAGAHNMILQLPQGYDTQISSMGTGLSGGQEQRIALARALYGNPKLIVLDEPSSSLDSQGIFALQKAICTLKQSGCTIILSTHQQQLLGVCEQILVLHADGRPNMIGPTGKVLEKLQAEKGEQSGSGQTQRQK